MNKHEKHEKEKRANMNMFAPFPSPELGTKEKKENQHDRRVPACRVPKKRELGPYKKDKGRTSARNAGEINSLEDYGGTQLCRNNYPKRICPVGSFFLGPWYVLYSRL